MSVKISKEGAELMRCFIWDREERIFEGLIRDVSDMDVKNSELNSKLEDSIERLEGYKSQLESKITGYKFQ